jgi:hypothetical protein
VIQRIPSAVVVSPLVAVGGGVIALLAALHLPWWAIAPVAVVEVLLAVCAGIALRRDGAV